MKKTSTMKTTPKMETCNVEGCIIWYLIKIVFAKLIFTELDNKNHPTTMNDGTISTTIEDGNRSTTSTTTMMTTTFEGK